MSEAEPRRSFDAAVHAYDSIRPSYPVELFDDLFSLLPDNPSIIEVGPGTGQATRDLLRRGAWVRAIEIGPSMAERLRTNLDSDRLDVVVGDFEVAPPPGPRFDAVFSATAYHWVSPSAQVDRPAELLGPGGTVAIVDLNQVTSPDDDGFFAAVQPIYDRHGQAHQGPPPPTREAVDPAIRATLVADSRFTDVVVRTYSWNQTYSAADYRTLMLSYSVTQMMAPHARRSLLDEIEHVVRTDFANQITRPIEVTLTTARLVVSDTDRSFSRLVVSDTDRSF